MTMHGQGFAPPPRSSRYWTGRQKVLLILLVGAVLAAGAGAAYYFADHHAAEAPKRTQFHNTKGLDYVAPVEKPVQQARPAATITPRAAVSNAVVPSRAAQGGAGEDRVLKSKISITNQDSGGTSYLAGRKADPDTKGGGGGGGNGGEGEDNALSKQLTRSNLGPKSTARVDEHYLYTISAGRQIFCNRMTSTNTQLAGFATCETTQKTLNDDNSAVLLPKGTIFFGEIKSQMTAGNDRIPILWRRFRTPDHPPIKGEINSPGADELGRAGAKVVVNNHIPERLLATLTYTLIEAVPNVAIAALQNHGNSSSGNQTNYNQFSTPSQNLGGTVLQDYMKRPPTGESNLGETHTIFLGTDIDLYDTLAFRTARGAP